MNPIEIVVEVMKKYENEYVSDLTIIATDIFAELERRGWAVKRIVEEMKS